MQKSKLEDYIKEIKFSDVPKEELEKVFIPDIADIIASYLKQVEFIKAKYIIKKFNFKYLVLADSNYNIILIDIYNNSIKVFEGHTNYVESVAFSPDGKYIASSSFDNTVRLWNIQSGECKVFEGHTDFVNSVAFSPDGKYIASASFDRTVRLWNIQSGECKKNSNKLTFCTLF